MIDSWYTPDHRDRDVFGDDYNPPQVFVHGESHLIATLDPSPNSDGQQVLIYECRLPARFFTIKVMPGLNSIGEPNEGVCIGTGSGDGTLAYQIAQGFQTGMLGVCKA
jgi:hypothetical protein